MTPSPTPQGISALLKRAGFEKAVVKMRGGCSGFRVSSAGPGVIWVWHYGMLGTSRTREAGMLAKYATVITDAGYAVETDADRDRLIVTVKPASLLAAKDGGRQ